MKIKVMELRKKNGKYPERILDYKVSNNITNETINELLKENSPLGISGYTFDEIQLGEPEEVVMYDGECKIIALFTKYSKPLGYCIRIREVETKTYNGEEI